MFLFLVPFVVMLIAHKVLNLSNHLLAAPEPGTRDWLAYNLFMILAFWTGFVGFYIHMTCTGEYGLGCLQICVLGGVLCGGYLFRVNATFLIAACPAEFARLFEVKFLKP